MLVESLFVNDFPSCHIHQDSIGLHPCQLLLSDEPFRRTGQRHRYDDDVGVTEGIFHILCRPDKVDLFVGLAAGIDCKYSDSKGPHERSRGLADAAKAQDGACRTVEGPVHTLSLIHISEPTRLGMISYAVFCLK